MTLVEDELTLATDFDLALTLESGQFFRADRAGEGFRVVVRDCAFHVAQEGRTLRYRGIGGDALARFLGLDRDTAAAFERLGALRWMREPLDSARGLTILRQDLWECLVGFLCSSASNIPRIRGQVEALARHFGTPIGEGDLTTHAFPRPGAIHDDARLRDVRLGYRARFLLELQDRVDEGWLSQLSGLPEEDQRHWLASLPGVGEKVADCVLLFALGRSGAFPIDVWIRRVMERRVLRRKMTYPRMRQWVRRTLGDDAGLAQQVLFVWARGRGAKAIPPTP